MEDTAVLAPHTTVAEIACNDPRAITVFEQLGIDYSCAGKRSLDHAALSVGCEAGEVIEEICRAKPSELSDWTRQPLAAVIRFLISDHGYVLEHSIPFMRELTERTISQHPEKSELRRIRKLLNHLTIEITSHTEHEEQDLFVIIGKLEATVVRLSEPPLRRIAQAVLREYVEHSTLRDHLRVVRELACRARLDEDDYIQELEAFRRNIHYHMHVENNILYPRAIAVENALRRA